MPPAPRPPLIVPFTKMVGAGNDFVVLDNRHLRFSDGELAALARRFCPPRWGVGADGLLALDEPEAGSGAHFRMRYRNADGSPATMCGNGARCLARFALLAGIEGEAPGGEAPGGDGAGAARHLAFDTDAGRYAADVPLDADADVTLHVPPPRGFGPTGLRGMPVPKSSRVYAIWTGTPHAVVFVPDVGLESVETVGGRIRYDEVFRPEGTNVDFVEVVDRGADGTARVRARTYEKGVEGETLACGTGALASALAARLAGYVQADRVEVAMPGGVLTVGFALDRGGRAEDARGVTLAGPAAVTFQGTLEATVELLAG